MLDLHFDYYTNKLYKFDEGTKS